MRQRTVEDCSVKCEMKDLRRLLCRVGCGVRRKAVEDWCEGTKQKTVKDCCLGCETKDL